MTVSSARSGVPGPSTTTSESVFAPLRTRKLSLISLMVVSIGLAFLMRYMYLIYFGAERKFFSDFRIQTNYDIGPISLPPKDYFIIVISMLVLGIVGLLLQRTKLGTAMRAVADNRDLAESSGIDVKRTILAVWIAGSGLAVPTSSETTRWSTNGMRPQHFSFSLCSSIRLSETTATFTMGVSRLNKGISP